MKTKYSDAKCEQYGRLLAALLCDQYFGARPTATLDGPAVLRFTPIRQVNLFVVQQLLGKWTAEMSRLRSPFFDFEDADVRQALTQFMNVLSKRIKLTRPAFEPLLATAIQDTLTGALDPAHTFAHKLVGEPTTVLPEQLREGLRYLDLNKPVFESFVTLLPAGQAQEREYLTSRFRLHLETPEATLQPLPQVLEPFNVLLPITEADLYEDQAAAAAPVTAPAAEKPAPAAPVAAPQPAPTPAAATPEPVAVAPPAPVAAEAPAAAVPLYEKLKADKPAAPTLSETLRPERNGAMLAEKAPKVESLREAISINQRFSFINELFNGENMEYHAAIQHLDTLPDADSAKLYVTDHLATQHNWTRKEEHVTKLLKLIDRKFA